MKKKKRRNYFSFFNFNEEYNNFKKRPNENNKRKGSDLHQTKNSRKSSGANAQQS